MQRVVLHSGDVASAELLRAALQIAGFEVVDAPTASEVLTRMAEQPAAAVILDLDDADGAGYLACKLLRERCGEQLPIILLSGERATAADRVVGLLLGADDYVVKPFAPSEVVTRARRLVARSELSPQPAAPEQREGGVDDFDLTERERQVMEKLLLGRTQAEIAGDLVISSNTVATHIQRILLKLGVHNRAQAVAKVARAGWLQRDLDDELETQARDRLDASGAKNESSPLNPTQ